METIGKVNNIPGEHNVEWVIPNFLSLSTEDGKYYDSHTFHFNGKSWNLRIYPNGRKEKNSVGYLELYLRRKSCDSDLNLDFSLSIKNSDGKKEEEKKIQIFEAGYNGKGFPCFISRFKLSRRELQLLPDNALTVVCTLKYPELTEKTSSTVNIITRFLSNRPTCFSGIIIAVGVVGYYLANIILWIIVLYGISYVFLTTGLFASVNNWFFSGVANALESSESHCHDKILHDFKDLFLKQENCDVVLRVNGREFPAHKAILTVRSPVFASTFRNDMKEKETGIVDIEDCDPSIFSDFLCFLYCGSMGILSPESVFSLFTVADKYDVSDLKSKCIEFMKDNLSIETFCETMSLALLHAETELICLATDFFIENAKKILENVKWQSFVDENPTQSNELFIKFVNSLKHPNT